MEGWDFGSRVCIDVWKARAVSSRLKATECLVEVWGLQTVGTVGMPLTLKDLGCSTHLGQRRLPGHNVSTSGGLGLGRRSTGRVASSSMGSTYDCLGLTLPLDYSRCTTHNGQQLLPQNDISTSGKQGHGIGKEVECLLNHSSPWSRSPPPRLLPGHDISTSGERGHGVVEVAGCFSDVYP
ncbi:hypothetical protein IW261DRAFT_1565063 [Armillaria novae-zelandiae]|uniref:Uncharacterized protein n=1 Tax=Armillaria novae-zelandiae TaxID=153914 RepID=A0AA39UHE3_9AGAR|nr:hypothetical protein IW261DRAFT_1565063 [Armillaria novae-zelandiae]